MSELADICARHAPSDGEVQTNLAGVFVYRRSCRFETLCGVQKPALGIVAQGSKTVSSGTQAVTYGPNQYLLISVDLPVTSHPVIASLEEPYLGIRIDLEPSLVWEVMVASKIRDQVGAAIAPGLMVSDMEATLADAVLRFIRLLDHPEDQDVLAPLLRKEIIYHLLRGAQTAALQRLATGDSGGCVLEAIRILRERYDQPMRIENLASDLGVSASGLHHQFKSVTTMSPLQYQKQLRLQEARRRLLGREGDAASVAFSVGYNSPSQFNREYKRLFGAPPAQDVERIRARAVG